MRFSDRMAPALRSDRRILRASECWRSLLPRWYVNCRGDHCLAHIRSRFGDMPSNRLAGLKRGFKPTHQAYSEVSSTLNAHEIGHDAVK